MSKRAIAIDASACWDGCELDFVTSQKGLFGFISALRTNALGGYVVKVPSGSVGRSMSSIEIRAGLKRLSLTIEDETAVFCGGPEALALLAKNLESLRLLWAKGEMRHLHFDPSSDTLLLSPDSEAFIVGPR